MNIKRLETFYWAVRLGSFKAAANKLNATQSTISMRIQELERELDVVLFDRSQSAARPTMLALDVMNDVERILRGTTEMRERISIAGLRQARIRMGVAEVVALTWFPDLLRAFHNRFPNVRIEIDEALTRELEAGLDAGHLDIVFAPGGAANSRHHVVPTGAAEFVWMGSPALGLGTEPLPPADLMSVPVILLAEESFHTATIEHWFGGPGMRPKIAGVCKSMRMAASMAANGLGMTLLPTGCFAAAEARGELVRIPTAKPFPIIPFRALIARAAIGNLAAAAAEIAAAVSTAQAPRAEPAAAQAMTPPLPRDTPDQGDI